MERKEPKQNLNSNSHGNSFSKNHGALAVLVVPFDQVARQIMKVIILEIANPTPKDENWTIQSLHAVGLIRMM